MINDDKFCREQMFISDPTLFWQLYSMNLVEKAKELKVEQKKSDALLFQMLPTSVAMRLKQTGKVKS